MPRYERKAILIVDAANTAEAEAVFASLDGDTLNGMLWDKVRQPSLVPVTISLDDGVAEPSE